MNDLYLKDIVHALNVVALEMKPDGRFFLLSDRTDWLPEFCGNSVSNECFLESKSMFGFLSDFVERSKEFWAENQVGCIKSGIWIEEDKFGKENMYEAMAICTAHKKILVVSQDQQAHLEKRMIIQKGRELSLDYRGVMRLQKEVVQAKNELEKLVEARTAELRTTNLELRHELKMRKLIEAESAAILRELQQSQKMEAIGTLASGIAHDFNNILSAVVGFTELSLIGIEPESAAADNMEKVLLSAERAKNLVRQILKFSSQAKEETRPVQIKTVVEETLTLIRASLPSTIEIHHNLNCNSSVVADFTQLHQVVMNLCTNASQAMHALGGTITIQLSDCEVDSDSKDIPANLKPGTYVHLSVEDTGRGMPNEVLERIFEPFFTTKNKNDGTGLGLSVVHGIIKRYGGGISVESSIGKGSLFHIFLPTIETTIGLRHSKNQQIINGDEWILFIDDEPLQVELAKGHLSQLGYHVVALTDSLEAFDQFRKSPNKFHLVITDLTMPKMTGDILAQQIHAIRPDLPIILCSGYSESISEKKALEIGICHYLRKPIAVRDLANSIRNVLDKNKNA